MTLQRRIAVTADSTAVTLGDGIDRDRHVLIEQGTYSTQRWARFDQSNNEVRSFDDTAAGVVIQQSAAAIEVLTSEPTTLTIGSVTWNCTGLTTDAAGSDLWPITWSNDGNHYTAWGDGNGFQGSTKSSYGFARLAGPASSYTATDLFASAAPDSTGKISGLLSVGGTIYGWKWTQSGTTHYLVKSTDYCATDPTETRVGWPNGGASSMVATGFVNMGQDYAAAVDGYVYSIAADWLTSSPVYMLRVPTTDIEVEDAYEVFSSPNATSPTWSTDMSERQPIYTESTAVTSNGAGHTTITYYPNLGQFVLTFHQSDNLGTWSIHQSTSPWGPWTLIERTTDWCGWDGQCVSEMLFRHMAPGWIGTVSSSTLDFYMVFSGAGTGNCDQFNLIRGTFNVS